MAAKMDLVSKLSPVKTTEKTESLSLNVTPPRTPTTLSTSAHQLLAEIQEIHDTISALSDLSPGPIINESLTRLVKLSIVPYSIEFTSYFFALPSVPALCATLRPLCSTSEGELERHWARKMLQDISEGTISKQDILSSFPYYQNYIDLSRLEYCTVSAYLPEAPKNIAFIGSGPLPLTSLCMLDACPTAQIVNIDRDATALRVSEDLCVALGHEARMKFACEDVDEDSSVDWKSFDVVFLAALVGEDTESKLRILERLVQKMRSGALVVARSAKGLREILYPVLDLSSDFARIGLEVLVEVHPWTKVVNSVVVFRVTR